MNVADGLNDRILVSIKEAAYLLGICERSLWTLVQERQIPHLRLGRRLLFSRDSLQSWVTEQQQKSSARAMT
ncbi:helix-turn-helix domain-containing protein [bacterium]|nr:helix-turn-helix domain-containing protein [bacterium]